MGSSLTSAAAASAAAAVVAAVVVVVVVAVVPPPLRPSSSKSGSSGSLGSRAHAMDRCGYPVDAIRIVGSIGVASEAIGQSNVLPVKR